MRKMELTQKQLQRQDFVDNEIHYLLEKLNPTDTPIDWNIENIAQIRDTVQEILTERLNLCTETEFYPFLEE